VGIERKNENSSAAERDNPEVCPAAIVDIEREVPGKTAERICAAPIHTAWGKLMSSISAVRGLVQIASTIHIITPPIRSAQAMMVRLSKFCPICFFRR